MPVMDSESALTIMMLSQRIPPDNCTGAPLQAWHLSKALVGRGHSVEVTTTHRLGIRPRRGSLDGIRLASQAYLEGPAVAELTRFARAACTTFSADRWDIVHGHALSPMVLGAALAKSSNSAPILVKPSIGGSHSEGEIRRIRHSAAYPLFLRALRKVDMFAVLDDLIDEDLASVGIPAERRRRVDNGIDLQAYQPANAAQKVRQREGIGLNRERMLLFCGQLSERKGIVELLNVWKSELARRHDTALVFCGDGPLRALVQRAADASAGDIAYLGPVTDTSAIIRMADVLILPSRCESFGNVVMEALASGVPVAATPCGIAPRVLAGEECGWLLAAADSDSIATGLARLFADMPVWHDKGIAGRLVAEDYAMDRIAQDYLAIYREMIEAGPGPAGSRLSRD